MRWLEEFQHTINQIQKFISPLRYETEGKYGIAVRNFIKNKKTSWMKKRNKLKKKNGKAKLTEREQCKLRRIVKQIWNNCDKFIPEIVTQRGKVLLLFFFVNKKYM